MGKKILTPLEKEIYHKTPEEIEADREREIEKKKFFVTMRARACRPEIISEELIYEIYRYLKVPNYVETVVGMVGISKDTFYAWAKRGARERRRIAEGKEALPGEHLYLVFSDAIKKGMAEGEGRLVGLTSKAAGTNWAAGMTLLERMHPTTFGRQRVEVTGADGKDLGGIPTVIILPDNGRGPKIIDGALPAEDNSTKENTSIESGNIAQTGGKCNLPGDSLSKSKKEVKK